MTRRAVLAASAVAGALILTASTAGAASAHTPVLVDHDNFKKLDVVLHVDDSIALRFSECTSCGYHWAFVKRPDGTLIQRTSRTTAAHHAPGVVGGSGTHSFRFEGLKAGKTTAKLGYFPPGTNTQPTRVVTVTFKVTN